MSTYLLIGVLYLENNLTVGAFTSDRIEVLNLIGAHLKLYGDRKSVLILLSDNGIGMKDEVKQKIFEHLFTTKEVGKGTGLGLAIARQIIEEKHQGKIAVNSLPGVGTEFVITLSLKALG